MGGHLFVRTPVYEDTSIGGYLFIRTPVPFDAPAACYYISMAEGWDSIRQVKFGGLEVKGLDQESEAWRFESHPRRR